MNLASDIQHYSQGKILRAILATAITHQASVVIWRDLTNQNIYLLADFSATPYRGRLDLQNMSGFAISPFVNPTGNHSQLLQADLLICFDIKQQLSLLTDNTPLLFWQQTQQAIVQQRQPLWYSMLKQPLTNHQKQNYIKILSQALSAINSGRFKKVVLARKQQIKSSQSLDLIHLFQLLVKKHSTAFVSLLSTPQFGTWMGASPELLLEVDQQQIFRTTSLAGTQAYIANHNISWGQKEIEEQAMVSRYINTQFKKLGLMNFVQTARETIRAGSVLHLKTQYQLDLKTCSEIDLVTKMLHLLHPTSAVCGLPKKTAFDFIQQHEAFERGLYSGYLGMVNLMGKTQLYVNLRCMQIQSPYLHLYAGAGITHQSEPEKEWQETQLKFKTLLDLLDV